MPRSLARSAAGAVAALASLALPATSQVIPVKTVPVASGDQFLVLPSATLGMGGVALAVDDSLADPWTNPAQGVF
ncbi:MAG: hypothetical protein FIA95_05715, partial [Gemmatimonadetes bacterium]|nr:hypothetical protein [Gemmatimonadota bacterium]